MNGASPGNQRSEYSEARLDQDGERCRLDMDPRLTKRSVRFGEESMSLSGRKNEGVEQDSEEPSDSEMDATLRDDGLRQSASNMDDDDLQESTFDPRLEQKIEQIKNNLRSGSVSNS